MSFKLKGIMWEIRLVLRGVGNIKNDIIVNDIGDKHEYLAKYHKRDKKEVKKIIDDDHQCKIHDGG